MLESGTDMASKTSCEFAIVCRVFDTRLQHWEKVVMEPWAFHVDVTSPPQPNGLTEVSVRASNDLRVQLSDAHLRHVQSALARFDEAERLSASAALAKQAELAAATASVVYNAAVDRIPTMSLSVALLKVEALLLTETEGVGALPLIEVLVPQLHVHSGSSAVESATTVHIPAVRVIDRVQQNKRPEFSELFVIAPHSTALDAITVTIISRPPGVNRVSLTDPEFDSIVTVDIGVVDVQWNPQTIKALQIFLYQQRGDVVESPHVVTGADEAAGVASVVGKCVRSKTHVTIANATLSFNKELEGRRLVRVDAGRVGVVISDEPLKHANVPSSTQKPGLWDSVVAGRVGQLAINDASTGFTEYPVVFQTMASDAPCATFSVRSYQGNTPDKPVDSEVTAVIKPASIVFLNQLWMELIGKMLCMRQLAPTCAEKCVVVLPPAADYILVGVMEPALLDAESLMKGLGQKPAGKNQLSITV